MKAIRSTLLLLIPAAALVLLAQNPPAANDWADWRGPRRDGTSPEKGLPEKWSLAGENLAWKQPYGGRSTPVILGDHLYLENTAGSGETEQERVLCFNADTGKLLWEYKFNLYQSDVPAHRVAWASPVADPETGNVYSFGVNNLLTALTRDGKKLWDRSITEEMSPFTTHGGRTISPIVDGNLVIVSTPTSTWGTMAGRTQRFIAMDKRTGDIVWVSTPGGRPYDTSYSAMNIVNINGTRLLITGGSDGAALAIKPQTGEPVWNLVLAKRGMNTGLVANGKYAIVSHGDENLEGNEMGLLAAFDATGKGKLGADSIKWMVKGFMGGFSSPVIDGDRLYQADNSATLHAFDIETGRQLWKHSLGTVQKASTVFADGKIYIGTESGKFFILRPRADRCDVLSEVELPLADTGLASQKVPEPVVSGAAVARGRVYFVSSDTLYAIGPKKTSPDTWKPVAPTLEAGQGPATWVQVAPTELILKPGESVQLHARLFDAAGRFLREDTAATWSLTGLQGTVVNGKFTAAGTAGQAGLIKATAGAISGRSTCARRAAAAVERDVRFVRCRHRAAALDQRHDRRQAAGHGTRRPEGAREGPDRHALQAHPRLHGPHRHGELHRGGRYPHHRKAPPDGRRRHHRAALHALRLRQQSAPGDEFVAARDRARRRRSLRVEAERLVPPEAARR